MRLAHTQTTATALSIPDGKSFVKLPLKHFRQAYRQNPELVREALGVLHRRFSSSHNNPMVGQRILQKLRAVQAEIDKGESR